jgi:hypothetical protein
MEKGLLSDGGLDCWHGHWVTVDKPDYVPWGHEGGGSDG